MGRRGGQGYPEAFGGAFPQYKFIHYFKKVLKDVNEVKHDQFNDCKCVCGGRGGRDLGNVHRMAAKCMAELVC